MSKSIYEYSNYKIYLRDLIDSYPNGGRGVRKALAESIRCQLGYITQVLSGDNHFSLEQAEASARYFSLNKDERDFFLNLVQFNRAGTKSLKLYFDAQLLELRERNNLLKTRLKIKETLPANDQAIYYSNWQFSTIHMLLTLDDFNTPNKISERLNLSADRALEVLEFLCRSGLAYKEGNLYKSRNPILHLEKDSPYLPTHHTNWRSKSIQSLDSIKKDDLHYSLTFTIAKKDMPKVREILTQALESCSHVIQASKEDQIAALCLDLFEI